MGTGRLADLWDDLDAVAQVLDRTGAGDNAVLELLATDPGVNHPHRRGDPGPGRSGSGCGLHLVSGGKLSRTDRGPGADAHELRSEPSRWWRGLAPELAGRIGSLTTFSRMATDYYRILGVERDADPGLIKKAFRRLARQTHPDANPGDAGAEARFREVAEAYEVLSDPERRRAYDRGEQVDLSGMFGDLDDLLRSVFGGSGFFGGGQSARGQDILVRVGLSLEEAAFGAETTVEFEAEAVCSACGGNGAAAGAQVIGCRGCGGSGMVRSTRSGFFGSMVTTSTCPRCGGRGREITDPLREVPRIGGTSPTSLPQGRGAGRCLGRKPPSAEGQGRRRTAGRRGGGPLRRGASPLRQPVRERGGSPVPPGHDRIDRGGAGGRGGDPPAGGGLPHPAHPARNPAGLGQPATGLRNAPDGGSPARRHVGGGGSGSPQGGVPGRGATLEEPGRTAGRISPARFHAKGAAAKCSEKALVRSGDFGRVGREAGEHDGTDHSVSEVQWIANVFSAGSCRGIDSGRDSGRD